MVIGADDHDVRDVDFHWGGDESAGLQTQNGQQGGGPGRVLIEGQIVQQGGASILLNLQPLIAEAGFQCGWGDWTTYDSPDAQQAWV